MNYPQFLNHHAAIQNSRRMWKALEKMNEENETTSTYKPLEIGSFKISKEVDEKIKREKKKDLRETQEVITVMLILVLVAIIIMSVALGGIKIIIV